MADILQRNSQGWPLYAVAYAFRFWSYEQNKIKETVGMEYMFAEHSGHARAQFLHANVQKMKFGKLEIISAAPVVGWHAQDDNGDVAIA